MSVRLRRGGRLVLALLAGLGRHLGPHEAGAGLTVRVLEQGRLLFASGVTAADYYLYGLERRHLSWDAKRRFMGEQDRRRWQERLNPRAYRHFAEDKLISKRYLAAAGIAVPRLLGVIGPHGRAETGEPLQGPGDLRKWLAGPEIRHVVLKPVLGSKGAGVLALGERLAEAEWERPPEGRITVEGVLEHLARYRHQPYFLAEERLRCHPALADLPGGILHTARVVTVLAPEPEVVVATFRIGRGAEIADNFSKGNLAAPVDLATGRLGSAVGKGTGLGRHRLHPDTGAAIEGRVLPDWPEAMALVRRAAAAVPFLRAIGWDVALTPDGPQVVELNGMFDLDLVQLPQDRGLAATALGRLIDGE